MKARNIGIGVIAGSLLALTVMQAHAEGSDKGLAGVSKQSQEAVKALSEGKLEAGSDAGAKAFELLMKYTPEQRASLGQAIDVSNAIEANPELKRTVLEEAVRASSRGPKPDSKVVSKAIDQRKKELRTSLLEWDERNSKSLKYQEMALPVALVGTPLLFLSSPFGAIWALGAALTLGGSIAIAWNAPSNREKKLKSDFQREEASLQNLESKLKVGK